MKELQLGQDYTGQEFAVTCPYCGGSARWGWHWQPCGVIELFSECSDCGAYYEERPEGCPLHPAVEAGDLHFHKLCVAAEPTAERLLVA